MPTLELDLDERMAANEAIAIELMNWKRRGQDWVTLCTRMNAAAADAVRVIRNKRLHG